MVFESLKSWVTNLVVKASMWRSTGSLLLRCFGILKLKAIIRHGEPQRFRKQRAHSKVWWMHRTVQNQNKNNYQIIQFNFRNNTYPNNLKR